MLQRRKPDVTSTSMENIQKRSEIQIYKQMDFKQQNDHLAAH